MPPISSGEYDATFGNAWHAGPNVKSRMTYVENAGDPNGSVTPLFIGQYCYDTTNKVVYIASGTTSSDWDIVSDPALTATTAEINRVADNSARFVAAGAATLAITEAAHDKKIVKLDQASGCTVTLPAATGSGMQVTFVQSVIPTSNSNIIQVADADDEMQGFAIVENDTDNSTSSFFAADNDDTITLNRTTTGGTKLGEKIVVTDFAANVWQVECYLAATGTEATPFSAAVS